MVSTQVTVLLHKNNPEKLFFLLFLCTEIWREWTVCGVAGQGSCVGPAHRDVRPRLDTVPSEHPLQHQNLSLSLPALPHTLLSFSHSISLPIYTLPVFLKHLSILPEKQLILVLFLSLLLSYPCVGLSSSFTSLCRPLPSPSANCFCEQAVMRGRGGENPTGDVKIHWLGGNFYL